ncbi:MAG TPA: GNAT family N-acetyltransferase [Candidatus Saccharimonadales bacterium]|nr:GNAT family N-acetyltransferase [Candidatus Saccharimonadales bacterium]
MFALLTFVEQETVKARVKFFDNIRGFFRCISSDFKISIRIWFERALQPEARNYWLTARPLGERAIVGYLEARKHDNGTQELRSLHIAIGRRGLGIGQALLSEAHTEWFHPNHPVVLDVAESNVAGQRFYRRPPNNYELTGHTFKYGPISMAQMEWPSVVHG